MQKSKSLLIFAIMSMLFLTGCDFKWFGELLEQPDHKLPPGETGAVREIQLYPLKSPGDSFTIDGLAADEKAVIGIAPLDDRIEGVGVKYRLRVRIQGMLDAQGKQTLASTDIVDQTEVTTQGIENGFDELVISQNKGVTDYRTFPGAFSNLVPAVRESNVEPLSTRRDFWVYSPNGNYIEVTATKVASRGSVNIYLDDDIRGISEYKMNQVANEVGDQIYPYVTGIFNEPYWLDKWNQEIDILVTNLDDEPGDYTLAGYFDERNYSLEDQYSNKCEMFYLNAKLIKNGEMNQLYATVAHELQHLLFFSNKLIAFKDEPFGDRFEKFNNILLYDDTWINEGFAVLSAHLSRYKSLSEDLRIYSQDYGYFGHTAEDGLLVWNNNIWEYGSVGLFAYYLYDHFGVGMIQEIMKTSDRFEDAIEDYVQTRYGIKDFPTLYGHWMTANRVDRLSNNWNDRNQYGGLVLKTQPVGEAASQVNEVSIWSSGVKYLEVQGPTDDLNVTVEQLTNAYPDQVQISVMVIAP